MNAEEVNKDQAALIRRLVALAPSGWKRIFVNYEMKDSDQGAVSNCVAFAVKKRLLGKVERIHMDTGADEWVIFNRLSRYFMKQAGQNHLTLDLLIRDDGTFKTYIDYEAPTRLGGDLLAVKRHLKYVDEDEYLRQIE
jgi:hypothetical protein